MKKVDISDLSFNKLPQEERINAMMEQGGFYNPFDLPDDIVMVNAVTHEVRGGEIADGTEHIIRNPFNSKIIGKALYMDNKPVKIWTVDENNEWLEKSKI